MNRIKDLLLSLFVLGSIVIVLLMVISFFNTKKTIYLAPIEEDEEKYTVLKEDVNTLVDEECKIFLKDYIEYTDKGVYDGEVKLEDVYNYMKNFTVDMYTDSINKCNFSEEELKDYSIQSNYVAILSASEAIMQKYMYTYELHLKDYLRNYVEPNVDVVLYNTIRSNQIEILRNYLKLAHEKESIYE